MNKQIRHDILISSLIGLMFFSLFPINAILAEVIIFDNITTVDKTVRLKVLTKGKFFSEGGKVVKFYINGKYISTVLSGGDGYAFLDYLPHSPGVKPIKVIRDDEKDEGILLTVERKNKVVMVEIEYSLIELPFNLSPSRESREAMRAFSKRFKIVYLTTLFGTQKSRKWLKDNDFPIAPILRWEGAEMFNELKDKGINLHAVIASPDIISKIPDMKNTFGFEEAEARNWDEILRQIK